MSIFKSNPIFFSSFNSNSKSDLSSILKNIINSAYVNTNPIIAVVVPTIIFENKLNKILEKTTANAEYIVYLIFFIQSIFRCSSLFAKIWYIILLQLSTVKLAIAAPNIPNIGTKIIFNIMLEIDTNISIIEMYFVFLYTFRICGDVPINTIDI